MAGAGRHQLWVIELSSNGRTATWIYLLDAEGLDDGPLPRLNRRASYDTLTLWFTNPEARLPGPLNWKKGQLSTLIGEGLFPGAIRSGLARRQNFNMQSESNFLAEISTQLTRTTIE